MNNIRNWVITLTGALFFLYAFLQANMMTSFHDAILKEFDIGIKGIGLLSGIYFYANVIFIIPAGLMIDRFSIKGLMSLNMIIVIIGTILFAFADTLFLAGIGRFLAGITMAFGLIICLKLASICLPPSHMALASSLIITIGMLGAVIAQSPLSYVVNLYGWRVALLSIAAFGVLILVILMAVVKNNKDMPQAGEKQSVLISLYKVIKEKQNWFSGLFICFLNAPVAIFGALFGNAFLNNVYKITQLQASSITSMLFWGMIIGSPFFGWLSDAIKKRKVPMYIGAIICLIFMLIILYSSSLNILSLHILFFIVGFTSAAQVIGYPIIAESNSLKTTGTGLSLAAIIIMGVGYGFALPLIGWLLDCNLKNTCIANAIYAYKDTFLAIPISILASIIIAFFIKETHCKSIYEE